MGSIHLYILLEGPNPIFIYVVVNFWPLLRSRHVLLLHRAPQPTNSHSASKTNKGQEESRSLSGTTSFRSYLSGSSTKSELFSYLEASISIAKIHSKDASISMTNALSEDFRFHSNDRSTMGSSRIAKSVAHLNLPQPPQRSRHYAA